MASRSTSVPAVQGDYARGARRSRIQPVGSDFALGLRRVDADTPARTGDFATGLRTQPATTTGSFATSASERPRGLAPVPLSARDRAREPRPEVILEP